MIFSREILIGILIALFIAGIIGGIDYYGRYKERKLNEVAELIFLYERGELKKEEVIDKVKDTPLYAYFLIISGAEPLEIVKNLKEEELKKLFIEKEAFKLYSSGQYDISLKRVSEIDEKNFNYPSSLLLKAFLLEEKGDIEGAKKVYQDIITRFPNTYFETVAKARLFMISRER